MSDRPPNRLWAVAGQADLRSGDLVRVVRGEIPGEWVARRVRVEDYRDQPTHMVKEAGKREVYCISAARLDRVANLWEELR